MFYLLGMAVAFNFGLFLSGGAKTASSFAFDRLVVAGDEVVFKNALGEAFSLFDFYFFIASIVDGNANAPYVIAVDDPGAVAKA